MLETRRPNFAENLLAEEIDLGKSVGIAGVEADSRGDTHWVSLYGGTVFTPARFAKASTHGEAS